MCKYEELKDWDFFCNCDLKEKNLWTQVVKINSANNINSTVLSTFTYVDLFNPYKTSVRNY